MIDGSRESCGRLPRTDDDAVGFELDNIKSGGGR